MWPWLKTMWVTGLSLNERAVRIIVSVTSPPGPESTSSKPSPALPGVMPLANAGGELAGFEASSWFGVLAPAGTPKDIVSKLQQEISQSLSSPAVKEKMIAQGADPVGNTPEQFAAHIQAETKKWEKVVKASGAKVD